MDTMQLIEKILEYLKNTGEFLASKGFELAYRQAIYYGISDLIWTVALVIVAFFLAKFFMKMTKWEVKYSSQEEEKFMWQLFSGIGFFVCVASSMVLLNCSLGWFINPEFGAVKILMSLVK